MTQVLVVSSWTEADLAEAVAWYENIRPGLGDGIVLCVEEALDRIREHPEAFPVVLLDVRRAIIRRFPYGVFFRVRPKRVEIEALFHLRVNPARLTERLIPGPKQAS